MSVEIERKFLVEGDTWRSQVASESHIMQGYLASSPEVTVRVRVKGNQAFLTIKGESRGVARSEYEYPIPVVDAEEMLRDGCFRRRERRSGDGGDRVVVGGRGL